MTINGSIPNFTNFPDSVMGPISMKEVLSKWTQYLLSEMKYALAKYYSKTDSDVGNVKVVRCIFEHVNNEYTIIQPVLEDMVAKRILYMKGIVTAIYGEDSDELYVYNLFFDTLHGGLWNEHDMWDDFASKPRLKQILYNC